MKTAESLNEVGMNLCSVSLRDSGDDYIAFDLQWKLFGGQLKGWTHVTTGAVLTETLMGPSEYADGIIDRLCEETQAPTEETRP